MHPIVHATMTGIATDKVQAGFKTDSCIAIEATLAKTHLGL